ILVDSSPSWGVALIHRAWKGCIAHFSLRCAQLQAGGRFCRSEKDRVAERKVQCVQRRGRNVLFEPFAARSDRLVIDGQHHVTNMDLVLNGGVGCDDNLFSTYGMHEDRGKWVTEAVVSGGGGKTAKSAYVGVLKVGQQFVGQQS